MGLVLERVEARSLPASIDEEIGNWQKMMLSCRKACDVLGVDFKEPEFLVWHIGRVYHARLWSEINHLHRKG